MEKICLMADSACDLTREMAEKYDIRILPVTITYAGSEHKEFEEIDITEYWEFLDTNEEQPTTAQITPTQYIEAFLRAKEDGYTKVIFLAINAAGSGTYNSGVIARDLFYGEYGEDMEIRVIDSQNYSYAYGAALILARRAIENGASFEEVVSLIEDHTSRVEAAAAVFTLRNLRKSGRVKGAAAIAGELLGIKPIIHLCSCGVDVVGKVRGDKAAVAGLIKFVDSRIDKTAPQKDTVCILYAKTPDEYAEMIEEYFHREFGIEDVIRVPLGGSICTNTGPNIVGIVYYGEKRA